MKSQVWWVVIHNDGTLHMVLCLMPKLSVVLEESKYGTHEINDFDEPIPHFWSRIK